MKTFSLIICLLCFLITAPAMADFYAGQVNYTQKHATGQGGEFSLEPHSGSILSNSAYDAFTRDQTTSGSFQTFCVEVSEHILDNSHVNVSEKDVSGTTVSYAYEGGGGTDGSGFGDPLDSRTAWLYTQFATGNLDGYDYDGTGGYNSLTRAQTAGALQRLIWSLEEEGGGTDWDVDLSSYYGIDINTDQRQLILNWQIAYGPSGWSGIGNVRVLQLYENYNSMTGVYDGFRQDQLYLTPVPGAVLLGLLGLGAAGMKLRRFA